MWLIILSNVDHSRLINEPNAQTAPLQRSTQVSQLNCNIYLIQKHIYVEIKLHQDLVFGGLVMRLKVIFYSDPSDCVSSPAFPSCPDVHLTRSFALLC